jgi:hypothetical protein
LASIALRRTFDHWVKVGRGRQLLRQRADQIGTRNAFNDLRDQHRLGDKHFRKEVVSRLLKVMDNRGAVEAWRATLTEKQRVEWASPDTIVRRCPVFNKPKAATAEARPSPYAKLQPCAPGDPSAAGSGRLPRGGGKSRFEIKYLSASNPLIENEAVLGEAQRKPACKLDLNGVC